MLGAVRRNRRNSHGQWLGSICIVILGIVLLTRIYDIEAGSITLIGVGAGLLAGLSYTVFIFGFKYAAAHGSPQAILVIAFTVLVSVLIWPCDVDQGIAVLSTPTWPMFVVMGVLGAGLSFILYIIGIKHATPAVASIVAMVEPVTASLFGVVVLNEELGGVQIFGMGLISVTVTVMSLKSSTQLA